MALIVPPDELTDDTLDDDAAFRRRVRQGLTQLDGGEAVPHDEVMAELRARICEGRAAYARGDMRATTPDEFMDSIARELGLDG